MSHNTTQVHILQKYMLHNTTEVHDTTEVHNTTEVHVT